MVIFDNFIVVVYDVSVMILEGFVVVFDYDVIFFCVDCFWFCGVFNVFVYVDFIFVIDGGIVFDMLLSGEMCGGIW